MRSIIFVLAIFATLLQSTQSLAAPSSDPSVYPLGVCIVSGEQLGADGDVVKLTVGTRQVQFCCNTCVKKFKKDQESYLQKLDAALIEAQSAFYPLETCVVSGEKLGGDMGDPVVQMVDNRMVKLCCKMCKKALAADPDKYLSKLDAAIVEAQKPGYPASQCPISGKELGSMGDTIDYVIGGRLVRLCCAECINGSNEHAAATLDLIYKNATAVEQKSHDDHSDHKHE